MHVYVSYENPLSKTPQIMKGLPITNTMTGVLGKQIF